MKLEVSVALVGVLRFKSPMFNKWVHATRIYKTPRNLEPQYSAANTPAMPQPPAQQTPDLGIYLDHFLRQVRAHHVVTPNRTPLPLHYDSKKELLVEWPWYVVCHSDYSFRKRCDDGFIFLGHVIPILKYGLRQEILNATGEPISSRDLVACAPSSTGRNTRRPGLEWWKLLLKVGRQTAPFYTENMSPPAQHSAVDTSVSTCQLCGTLCISHCCSPVCLERFYTLNGLKLMTCAKRGL